MPPHLLFCLLGHWVSSQAMVLLGKPSRRVCPFRPLYGQQQAARQHIHWCAPDSYSQCGITNPGCPVHARSTVRPNCNTYDKVGGRVLVTGMRWPHVTHLALFWNLFAQYGHLGHGKLPQQLLNVGRESCAGSLPDRGCRSRPKCRSWDAPRSACVFYQHCP